jgi:hypothetical protein
LRGAATGLILAAVVCLMIAAEALGEARFAQAAGVGVAVAVIAMLPQAGWAGRVFVALAILLAIIALVGNGGAPGVLAGPLAAAGFIAAFFSCIAALREAALTSPSLERSGRFFAEQKPGRRYLMLTLGGHFFALALSYGALSLLGTMAERVTRREPDPEIRAIRMRRMLMAIQRGLVATLCWSPVAFPMALATTLVPGADWTEAAPFCVVSGLLLMALGWGLDTAFKPTPMAVRPAPVTASPGGVWTNVRPLAALLTAILVPLVAIQLLTGMRAVAAAMVLLPPLCLAWVAFQEGGGRTGLAAAMRRGLAYFTVGLPGYGNELVILTTAGFIGSLGAGLAEPWMRAAGIDLAILPAPLLVLSIVWLLPITGQIGMNPILALSLVGPLLPPAGALGLSPAAFVLALTAGWALSGASSPFTASTLLLARLGGVSARHVGLRWNGAFTVLGGMLLSAWLLVLLQAGLLDQK